MGTTLANDIQHINSTSQVGSTNAQHMHRAHETSTSPKIYLATVGINDVKYVVYRLRLVDLVEVSND